MMNETMGGGMMWGMGLWWILVVTLLVLGIAALAKYVFWRR
jgi:flagellar basal body-associated protein FliL